MEQVPERVSWMVVACVVPSEKVALVIVLAAVIPGTARVKGRPALEKGL